MINITIYLFGIISGMIISYIIWYFSIEARQLKHDALKDKGVAE